MKEESIQTAVRFPVALLERLNELVPSGKRRDFIREACAEKLARDFGIKVEAKLSRKNQGKRNDLSRLRAALEEVESVVSGGRITDSDLSKIVKKSASLAAKTRKKARS